MPEISELYLSSNIRVGFADGSTWLFTDQTPKESQQPPGIKTFVITACDPKGVPAELSTNHLNTLALEQDLINNELEFFIGWGSSQDNLHAELSFCIPVNEPEAEDAIRELVADLAFKYEQNAIFEITKNEVTLVPCLQKTATGTKSKYAIKLDEPQSKFRALLDSLRWAAEVDPRDLVELDRFILNHQPPFDAYDL
jgi:hypothetical protein